MKESITEAILLTADHFIFGKLITAPRRLSDVLNDPMTSHVTLLEVELVRSHEPKRIVDTFSEMFLAKAHILAAIVTKEPVGDDQRRLYTYRHKKPERLYVCIPPYEIEGLGYLERVGGLHAMFSTEAREFVPLTEAIVVLTSNPDVRLRAEVMLVNWRAICGVSSSKEVGEDGKTPAQPSEGSPPAKEE